MRIKGLFVALWICSQCAFAQNFIFEKVHVYNVAAGSFSAPMDVVVIDGSIAHLGNSRGYKAKGGYQVIDGKRGYLIPGLWDAHVHIRHMGMRDMGLFVKNGVIGLRDMGGRLDQIDVFRNEKSAALVPEVYTAGPILESANWLNNFERDFGKTDDRVSIAELEQVVPAIDSLVAMGVDFLKLRSAPSKEVFEKILETSRQKGLGLTGHIPSMYTLGQVAEAGLTSIEHSIFMGLMEAPQVTREANFQQVKEFAKLTPTLITDSIAMLTGDEVKKQVIIDSDVSIDPRIKEISDELHDYWKEEFMKMIVGDMGEMDMNAIVKNFHGMSRQMADLGVEMMVGTDSPVPMVFPGSSVHSEMIMMQQALGMEPADILKAAVFNTPDWLGLEAYGAIEVGKKASLVLLSENPLKDIANIRTITGVMHRGSYLKQ